MSVKDLIVMPIKKPQADVAIKKYHYSGKVCPNSQLNYGVFKNRILVGAIQYGPSTDKKRMAQSLCCGSNELIELNRVAISDVCGKNTESRCIGYTLRDINKRYPHIKAVVSFADACQCGDGQIYRALGFKLHSIKTNKSLLRVPESAKEYLSKYIKNIGDVVSTKTLNDHVVEGGALLSSKSKALGLTALVGYQMKYIFILKDGFLSQHKFIEYKDIPEYVKMYKGKKYATVAQEERTTSGCEMACQTDPVAPFKKNGVAI